jgi:predicted HTH transcriptional regulator
MDWDKIIEDISIGTSTKMIFLSKVDLDDDLGPYIVAMANSQGGKIYIGLDIYNVHLIGTDVNEDWINKICQNLCNPKLTIQTITFTKNEKIIICLEIPEGEAKPYYYKNYCYLMETDKDCPTLIKQDHKLMFETPPNLPKSEALVMPFSETETETETETEQTFPTEILEEPKLIQEQIPEIKIEPEPTPGLISETEQLTELPITIESTNESLPSSNENLISEDNEPFKQDIEKITNQLIELKTPDNTDSEPKLNDRQKQTLDYLKQNKEIQNKKYREIFNISHKTAHLELTDLTLKNLIEKKGAGRSTFYSLK